MALKIETGSEETSKPKEEKTQAEMLEKDLFPGLYDKLNLSQFVIDKEKGTVDIPKLEAYLREKGFSEDAIKGVEEYLAGDKRGDKQFSDEIAARIYLENEEINAIRSALKEAFETIEDENLRQYLLERVDEVTIYLIKNFKADLGDKRKVSEGIALYVEANYKEQGHDIDTIEMNIRLSPAKSDEIEFYLITLHNSGNIARNLLNINALSDQIKEMKNQNPSLTNEEALKKIIEQFSHHYYDDRFGGVLFEMVCKYYEKSIPENADEFYNAWENKDENTTNAIVAVMDATGNLTKFSEEVAREYKEAIPYLFECMLRVGVSAEEMNSIANHLFSEGLIDTKTEMVVVLVDLIEKFAEENEKFRQWMEENVRNPGEVVEAY